MNFFKLSAWSPVETCSALTVVPRITNKSTPASITTFASAAVRAGESAAATVTTA